MNDKMATVGSLIPVERIERSILLIRGQKVMLDRDLAYLYGVPTKVLNQTVKRHIDRFPDDFIFQLTMEEARVWWEQVRAVRLRSQIVTLERGQHIKYRPYAFTEHGGSRKCYVGMDKRIMVFNYKIISNLERSERNGTSDLKEIRDTSRF